jgi:hypothetical protein
MMFQVRWERRAINELTTLWSAADSTQRHAITAASHAIDQRLKRDPENEGESRAKGRRVTFVAPLAVTFRVDADDRTVSVLYLRLFQRRP